MTLCVASIARSGLGSGVLLCRNEELRSRRRVVIDPSVSYSESGSVSRSGAGRGVVGLTWAGREARGGASGATTEE